MFGSWSGLVYRNGGGRRKERGAGRLERNHRGKQRSVEGKEIGRWQEIVLRRIVFKEWESACEVGQRIEEV
jgi:hypothetical protein